jgi:hypothetical protein
MSGSIEDWVEKHSAEREGSRMHVPGAFEEGVDVDL